MDVWSSLALAVAPTHGVYVADRCKLPYCPALVCGRGSNTKTGGPPVESPLPGLCWRAAESPLLISAHSQTSTTTKNKGAPQLGAPLGSHPPLGKGAPQLAGPSEVVVHSNVVASFVVLGMAHDVLYDC